MRCEVKKQFEFLDIGNEEDIVVKCWLHMSGKLGTIPMWKVEESVVNTKGTTIVEGKWSYPSLFVIS